MAGDWIKVECSTPDKPEVYSIAEILDIQPEHVVGCLVSLWVWADQQTTDGNAAGVTRTLVDRKSGVTGFADAMKEVGWLEETEKGLRFPNFDRHNGKTAKNRSLTAKRVAKHKRKSNDKGNGEGNGGGNDVSVTDALPREEKRRVKDYSPNGECGSPAGEPPADPGGGPLKLNGSGPTADRTPYQEIINLYRSCCASLPDVIKLTPARKQAIRARCKSELPSLTDWEKFFKVVEMSDFLTGRAEPSGGRSKPFLADLDFLIKQGNCVKVMEGKYDD